MLFGIGGLVLMPLISTVLPYRTHHMFGGWRVQFVMIAMIVLVFGGIARWTARITPKKGFDLAFGVPIPANIRNLQAEGQYYDGFIVSLAFQANAQDMKKILAARPFIAGDLLFDDFRNGRRSWTKCWESLASPWVKIVHPRWPYPPTEPATDYYHLESVAGEQYGFVRVFWSSRNGQAYVLCVTD